MAPLIDYREFSDDDLPRRQIATPSSSESSRQSDPTMIDAAFKIDEIPILAATSSTRKVRRFGASAPASTNPLLLPWNDGNMGSAPVSIVISPEKISKKCRSRRGRIRGIEDTSTEPRFRSHCIRQPGVDRPSYEGCEYQASQQQKFATGHGQGVDKPEKDTPPIETMLGTAELSDTDDSTSYETAVENTSDSGEDSDLEFMAVPYESREDLKPLVPHARGRSASRGLQGRPVSPLDMARQTSQNSSPRSLDFREDFEKLKSKSRNAPDSDTAAHRSHDSEKLRINLGDSSLKGIVSPRKPACIPETCPRPGIDAFWSPKFVDEWNDQHSPRKPLSRPIDENPVKTKPTRATRNSFTVRRRPLAEEFFRELDAEITHGKIAELAASTGGVKLVWTKALITTAGRANWRRETTRTQPASGKPITVTHRHHASIELAEKVIDSEDKLLNVLAHEFCHLANFMISGVTCNPHGKEFKSWADKCFRKFGDSRGIRVTTKHTYEINFRYIWTCTMCGCDYRRHSKSLDPRRHRCGSCKGLLMQTKPVPRGEGGGAGGGAGKRSEYQAFVKDQMKIVRGENPGKPQKEVMRIVAGRWTAAKKSIAAAGMVPMRHEVDGIAEKMARATLDEGGNGE